MTETKKWVQKGEIVLRGKVLKLSLGDPNDPKPIRLFCLVDDMNALLDPNSNRVYVRLFLETNQEETNIL